VPWALAIASLVTSLWAVASDAQGATADGRLRLTARDESTGRPIAVRLELRDARGRPVRIRAAGAVATEAGLYFEGEVQLALRRGEYTFLMEAGPEYRTRPGSFRIERNADDTQEVTLRRRVDMRSEGWWAGDLEVLGKAADLPLQMRARGVDLAVVTRLVNRRGRCQPMRNVPSTGSNEGVDLRYFATAMSDQRRGGTLLLVDRGTPDAEAEETVDICRFPRGGDSLSVLDAAHTAGLLGVAGEPYAWDFPLWVASGKLTAVEIMHGDMARGVAADRVAGRPGDKRFYPGKRGNGLYSEAIYHHLLNCGIRLPPVAGSGAGTTAAPVGRYRTYVQLGDRCDWQRWLQGLREGKVVVTGGPLLRTSVEGHPPGHVFQRQPGGGYEFQIALQLAFYEAAEVEYLEIVQNGVAIHQVRLSELASRQGRLPAVTFDRSGWFCVRAVTDGTEDYQYATTGPYYVQVGDGRTISRRSVQFFLAWLDDLEGELEAGSAVAGQVGAAREYWQGLLAEANVE
jgi:hypothetical protein